MTKQTLAGTLLLALVWVLSIATDTRVQARSGNTANTRTIPVIDIRSVGHRPVHIETTEMLPGQLEGAGGGSNPANPYAAITKTGPVHVRPDSTIQMAVTLNNFESITCTFRLTDTLPAGLTYLPNPDDGLTYHSATRTLHWQGVLAPGHLNYLIEPGTQSLPYLDLAAFGVGNLCDAFVTCDDAAATFNLGINGYTANLYGTPFSQLTVSANGLVLAAGTAVSNPYKEKP